jgi:hypothetical protein
MRLLAYLVFLIMLATHPPMAERPPCPLSSEALKHLGEAKGSELWSKPNLGKRCIAVFPQLSRQS